MVSRVTAVFGFLLVLVSVAPAQTGLLIVAHGANAEWNSRVRETVAQVWWPHGPVSTAFLMGVEAVSAGWDAGIDSLVAGGARSMVVVPLMVSSHGAHVREVEFYAGMRDSAPEHQHHVPRHVPPPLPVMVTSAIDAAPELGAAIARHWSALDASDRSRAAVLVAHGPTDEAEAQRWIDNLERAAAEPLAKAGLAGPLHVRLLRDDAPAPVRSAAVAHLRGTITALATAADDSVVVIPVLISSGSIDRVKIPRDLEGLPVRYLPAPLAPQPELVRWIERVAGIVAGER